MKYLEELDIGDCFLFENSNYIKLSDFKKNGDRCCVDLKKGITRWIKQDSIVNISPIYSLDKENNLLPIKETKKEE